MEDEQPHITKEMYKNRPQPNEKNVVRDDKGRIKYYISSEDNPHPITDIKIKRELWEQAQRDRIEELAKVKYDRVDHYNNNPHAFRKVTDKQFPMDGLLKSNLEEIIVFLKKKYDAVIIVSGSGDVRVGKSALSIQIAYYIAWLINEIKKKNGEVPKDNPVPFTNANIAFDPDTLMKLAEKLPRNSVITYDEASTATDSANGMSRVNKSMAQFFNECGQYGHVIILTLPDYFKLSEMLAGPRSLFLVNVFVNNKFDRGFFNFFNKTKKETLYLIGKKKFGTKSKYFSVKPNFYGKFPDYFPIDREKYEEQKRLALKKKKASRLEAKWREQRDASWYLLYKINNLSQEDIAKELESILKYKLSRQVIDLGIKGIQREMKKEYHESDE